MVRDMWVERDGVYRWDWIWRRRLFAWENTMLAGLLDIILNGVFSEEEDKWEWRLEDNGIFSVKSAYLLLGSVFSPESTLGDLELRVLNNMWKSPAPSKVLAFSWKLVRDRLPTRENLRKRGVVGNGGVTDCVHCNGIPEAAVHLFLHCNFASSVWKAVFRWLGLVLVIPPSLPMLFECFVGVASSKQSKVGFSVIWHATVWSIWRLRNSVIFSNGVSDVEVVVDSVKLLSWRWSLSHHKIPICLFYEWCWDPGLCLRL
jgi:hypothetical protein